MSDLLGKFVLCKLDAGGDYKLNYLRQLERESKKYYYSKENELGYWYKFRKINEPPHIARSFGYWTNWDAKVTYEVIEDLSTLKVDDFPLNIPIVQLQGKADSPRCVYESWVESTGITKTLEWCLMDVIVRQDLDENPWPIVPYLKDLFKVEQVAYFVQHLREDPPKQLTQKGTSFYVSKFKRRIMFWRVGRTLIYTYYMY